MTEDDWQMADGFAPVSRLHYCQHPRACSAPQTGRCPRCQLSQKARAALHKHQRHLSSNLVTSQSVPTYLDPDFDDFGE